MRSIRYAAVASAVFLASNAAARGRVSDNIAPNGNRAAAGTLKNGVLTIALEARTGTWRPEGNNSRGLDLAAFAEVGKPLSTPGPLIRVPVGTDVRASIHNMLDKPLLVFGFGKRRGAADSVVIAKGATVQVHFIANAVGTFYYVARRAVDDLGLRPLEDTQLNGLMIVDPRDARPDPNERLMAITWAFTINPKSKSGLGHGTMSINGLSWPHTERLDYAQGDSIRWRVVNFTESDHPMHLHGFFFRVNAKGDGVTDSVYSSKQQRMAVTEVVDPFQTLSLAWQADRPGNWIFHCHYATHLSTLVELDTEDGDMDPSMPSHHPSDRPHQMFGLVMGIAISPKGAVAASNEPPRNIRIVQREKANVYGKQPGMSFVVDGTAEAKNPNALPVPGPMLVLERGKRVAVTIVNQSNDHAAVHWHGIELESYPDGVPGWSGSGKNILPPIAPHDSMTVRWTPTRAGSFMYHSHFNEAKQMGSGLYGPIIVVEPGTKFDPETDRILFFGTAGHQENVIFGPTPSFVLNGKTQPEPMNLKVGTRYRFRLFNLAGDSPTSVSIDAGKQPVLWRAVAKDGYPLPESQATMRPAKLMFDPGEIYDFELTPTSAGELTLTFGPPPPPPGAASAPPPPPGTPVPFPAAPTIKVAIHVR
jgi:FtsP/CotA-like multicopper oxidase with cupredoxin domain